MQQARFVRALGLLLVLGLGGSVVGCGSGAQDPPAGWVAQKAIRAEIRKAQQKQLERGRRPRPKAAP
jgi:hypothetical protein